MLCSCSSTKKWTSVQVEFYQDYCGGARPSEDMIAEYEKPKILANEELYLISESDKALKIKTDEQGLLKAKLSEGKYRVMEAWRYKKATPDHSAPTNYNGACLSEEWKKVAMELQVKGGALTATTTHAIKKNCAWDMPCMLEEKKPTPAE